MIGTIVFVGLFLVANAITPFSAGELKQIAGLFVVFGIIELSLSLRAK